LPPILAPLAPFQKQLTVVTGCENKAVAGTALHATTPGTWLSCAVPRAGYDPCGGITVDQIAAEKIGYDTPLRSIEVGTEEQGGEGSWDRKYGAGYGKTISFRTPATPLPMEHDPRRLFQLLIGRSATPAAAATERSVLDLLRRPAADLGRGLGCHDRAKLDDYLLGMRAIERRVQNYRPTDPFHEHIELMFDLIALACQANLTRVVTYMMAAEVSMRSHPSLGIDADIHSLSHHQNNPEKIARLSRVQAFHTRIFASFVQKLARMPDGDGSMLDHSLILYGSNMGNSYLHDHVSLPLAVVGGGCGKLAGNQHLRCPQRTPLANLHLTLLNRAGIPTESFADSSGELTQI
jgi:hypothetical protein